MTITLSFVEIWKWSCDYLFFQLRIPLKIMTIEIIIPDAEVAREISLFAAIPDNMLIISSIIAMMINANVTVLSNLSIISPLSLET